MDAPPRNHRETTPFDTIRAIKVLGKGAMGTVFLVHNTAADPRGHHPYALKVVEKSTKSAADRRARWEIEVLIKLSGRNSNPFLPNLISSFENSEFIAFAVPYCSGGDLNVLRHRQVDRVFSSAVARFYLAEIVCAVEHLHNLGIVYRDLKPENILVQDSGHVTLTDFDLSRFLAKRKVKTILNSSNSAADHRRSFDYTGKLNRQRKNFNWITILPNGSEKSGLKKTKSARVSPVNRRRLSYGGGERSNSFVGTEEYVSPEVVRGDGHEFAVDWWALGVLAYEMVYGTTPFKGRSRKETFRNVLGKEPEFVGKRNELTDLIERLLEKDPTKRMGYQGGASEIKGHVFFKGVQWDLLTEVLRPPFVPDGDGDGGDVTETVAAGGFDVREYYCNLRAPPSPSSECCRSLSLTEF